MAVESIVMMWNFVYYKYTDCQDKYDSNKLKNCILI